MSKIELPTITSGYNLSTINNNFQKIEDALNEEVLYRKGYTGEPNEMQTNLDMNGKEILNVVVGSSPGSLATKGYVDQEVAEERSYVDQQLALVDAELDTKYDKSGGPVSGNIQMQGHKIVELPNATQPSEPATYAQLLQVESGVDSLLRNDLASVGGAGLIGGVAQPVTAAEFAGGADPTGTTPSDAAFAAAGSYVGDIRVEGNFLLSAPINRTESVMEIAPGSSVTPNRMFGGDTTLGSGIPSRTIYGRVVIRDNDGTFDPNDGFVTYPDMGQALRLDSKAVQGQCGMFVSADRGRPIIGPTAYVGIHSKHNQTLATPKTWAINPIIVKNVRASDLPPGVDSETIGMEISCANNTDERGQPQGAGMLEGLFVSYAALVNEGSCAITTGGLTAGWRSALWLDGVSTQGTHIFLRDENSANAGVRCGIDTTGTSNFTDGAVLLGRGHSITSLDTGGAIRTLLYISSANEIVHGHTANTHRFTGPLTLFDHNISGGTANTYTCGTNARPWAGGFTQTAFTVTSDEHYKTKPLDITDAMLDAASEVDWVQYQYLDRVEVKGPDGARWHFGAVAQRYVEAFARHGLDAHDFAFLCYDEWEDQYEDVQTNIGETTTKTKMVTAKKSVKKTVKESKVVRNNSGEMVLVEVDVIKEEPVLIMEYVKDQFGEFVLKEDGTKMTVFVQATEEVETEYESPADPVYERQLLMPAGSRYGIRYEEALALEAALQRRRCARIEARLALLGAWYGQK